jgi:hypothetical protein
MLKHNIILKKPRLQIAENTNHYRYAFEKKVKNQLELNDFLNTLEFTAGEFVTYVASRTLGDIYQIHYVRYIEVDFDKIRMWSQGGQPEIVHMAGAWHNTDRPDPPWEWRTGFSFRPLTMDEATRFIDDQVHDHIKKRLQLYSEISNPAS